MKIVFWSYLFLGLSCFYGCSSAAPGKKSVTDTVKTRPVDVVLTEPSSLVNYIVQDSLSPVLAQAKLENKPVFVDFYTTWCTPCRLMDETVFRDEALADYMNKNILSLKVNAEIANGLNLRTIFNVASYPTMVFLDFNGNELVRKEGSCSTTAFKKMAEEAVEKMKNK